MSSPVFEGGCLCGEVRYRASGEVSDATFCHCGTCRRAAGAPVVAWITVPVARFAFTRGGPVEFHSSPPVTRSFCGACGTPLTYRHASSPDAIDVTTASCDEPEAFPPADHTWTSHGIGWMQADDGLPRHRERRDRR